MPRKLKAEETIIKEENTILEASSTEAGMFLEKNIAMEDGMPAGEVFPTVEECPVENKADAGDGNHMGDSETAEASKDKALTGAEILPEAGICIKEGLPNPDAVPDRQLPGLDPTFMGGRLSGPEESVFLPEAPDLDGTDPNTKTAIENSSAPEDAAGDRIAPSPEKILTTEPGTAETSVNINDSSPEAQPGDASGSPSAIAARVSAANGTDVSAESGSRTGHNAVKDVPEAAAPPKKKKTGSSAPAAKPEQPAPAKKPVHSTILTLNADAEVETPERREDTIWHEIQNAYRTRRILTGILGGIEKMDGGGTIAVVYYKEVRIVIPLAEMMINLVEDEAHDYGELALRQSKILGNMLGCEIDFIIKGLENASRSVVASRRDAMYRKRQIFYMPDAAGNSRVCEDRIVQARVIAVAEKVVRVEIFGAECSILARDLSWDWLGDASERFHVGEQILVRILSVKVRSLGDISVKADVKSVNGNTSRDNLGKCRIQGKYAGTVTDIHKGTVFVRLHIGVNAVAHSCYDNRMPGKKDDVSFVVTRIDSERNVAVGLISRIIKQNI